MITSILYSSPTFEAVDYNERKVANGVAQLLVSENMGYAMDDLAQSPNQRRQYLIDYSERNDRIQKPQMHVSFSAKGDEMDNAQLVAFARQWLKEMGYAHPEQPLLIYGHSDTNNNHIHVITSRVAPDGHKIAHHHERVRSKAFVEKMLGVDTRANLEKAVENALSYKFASFGAWAAVMEAQGYEVRQKGEDVKIARNGAYQTSFPLSLISERIHPAETSYEEKKRRQQMKMWLLKYRDKCCSKEELQEVMKKTFGVDLVFFGGKDTPRGYFLIDHKNKEVTKGSAILKTSELLQFENPEDKLERIGAFVDEQLECNSLLSEKELDTLLRKHYGASYHDGIIRFNGSDHEVPKYMKEALYANTIGQENNYMSGEKGIGALQSEGTTSSNTTQSVLQHHTPRGANSKDKKDIRGSSANREWEVGTKNDYDDIDDARKFKR